MKYNALNAVIYDILWRVCDNYPSLRQNPLIKRIMDHCFPDWVEWKTETTMKNVNRLVEEVKNEWRKEENEAVREKFQEAYPEAKVTTHDEVTGAVLIEHPPDGSKAQELLGGAMEIKSPWSEGKK